MIILACAFSSIVILGYSFAVATFVRQLPERQEF
jgi:hypothetical protein